MSVLTGKGPASPWQTKVFESYREKEDLLGSFSYHTKGQITWFHHNPGVELSQDVAAGSLCHPGMKGDTRLEVRWGRRQMQVGRGGRWHVPGCLPFLGLWYSRVRRGQWQYSKTWGQAWHYTTWKRGVTVEYGDRDVTREHGDRDDTQTWGQRWHYTTWSTDVTLNMGTGMIPINGDRGVILEHERQMSL